MILKTFIMLGIVASQCWATSTSYISGADDLINGRRHDRFIIGSNPGHLGGYTQPATTTSSLYIEFVPGSGAQNLITTSLVLPNTVKHLWITGDASGYDNVTSGGNSTLPIPVLGGQTIIHFALLGAPASVPNWFASLPSDCTIVVEQGVDPYLDNRILTSNLLSIILKRSITLGAAASTVTPKITRDPSVPACLASLSALVTLGGPTTFTGGVAGVSITGGAVTLGAASEVVSPGTISAFIGAPTVVDLTLVYPSAGSALFSGTVTNISPLTQIHM